MALTPKKPKEWQQARITHRTLSSSSGIRGKGRKRHRRGIWRNQDQGASTHLQAQRSRFRSFLIPAEQVDGKKIWALWAWDKGYNTSPWGPRWFTHSSKPQLKLEENSGTLDHVWQESKTPQSLKWFFFLQHFVGKNVLLAGKRQLWGRKKNCKGTEDVTEEFIHKQTIKGTDMASKIGLLAEKTKKLSQEVSKHVTGT